MRLIGKLTMEGEQICIRVIMNLLILRECVRERETFIYHVFGNIQILIQSFLTPFKFDYI